VHFQFATFSAYDEFIGMQLHHRWRIIHTASFPEVIIATRPRSQTFVLSLKPRGVGKTQSGEQLSTAVGVSWSIFLYKMMGLVFVKTQNG
jgi:hypothetical protein